MWCARAHTPRTDPAGCVIRVSPRPPLRQALSRQAAMISPWTMWMPRLRTCACLCLGRGEVRVRRSQEQALRWMATGCSPFANRRIGLPGTPRRPGLPPSPTACAALHVPDPPRADPRARGRGCHRLLWGPCASAGAEPHEGRRLRVAAARRWAWARARDTAKHSTQGRRLMWQQGRHVRAGTERGPMQSS